MVFHFSGVQDQIVIVSWNLARPQDWLLNSGGGAVGYRFAIRIAPICVCHDDVSDVTHFPMMKGRCVLQKSLWIGSVSFHAWGSAAPPTP